MATLTQEEITHQSNRIFPILHYLHANGEFDNVISTIKAKLDTNPCPPGKTWNGTKCVDDFPPLAQ